MTNFDFDEWAELYRRDPELFEQRRKDLLEAAVSCARPELQPRLRGLQWQLDAERAKAKTPMGACVRMNQLMMRKLVHELSPALNYVAGKPGGTLPQRAPAYATNGADVLIMDFRRRT